MIALASLVSLIGISSTAEAKGARKHKGKRAQASKVVKKAKAADAVPWYEQGIDELKPVAKKNAPAPAKALPKTGAVERVGQYQRRRTQAPAGLCQAGCDKSARKISMTKLVLVADGEVARPSAARKSKRALKRARARVRVATKK